MGNKIVTRSIRLHNQHFHEFIQVTRPQVFLLYWKSFRTFNYKVASWSQNVSSSPSLIVFDSKKGERKDQTAHLPTQPSQGKDSFQKA